MPLRAASCCARCSEVLTRVLTRDTTQPRPWLATLLVRKMSKVRLAVPCATSAVYCALTGSTVELQLVTCTESRNQSPSECPVTMDVTAVALICQLACIELSCLSNREGSTPFEHMHSSARWLSEDHELESSATACSSALNIDKRRWCRPACGTMKRADLNIVAAGYGACVLDSGCQVAALSQGLEHAACGIVELAHLRAQAALLT